MDGSILATVHVPGKFQECERMRKRLIIKEHRKNFF